MVVHNNNPQLVLKQIGFPFRVMKFQGEYSILTLTCWKPCVGYISSIELDQDSFRSCIIHPFQDTDMHSACIRCCRLGGINCSLSHILVAHSAYLRFSFSLLPFRSFLLCSSSCFSWSSSTSFTNCFSSSSSFLYFYPSFSFLHFFVFIYFFLFFPFVFLFFYLFHLLLFVFISSFSYLFLSFLSSSFF